jgi:hypothetical protein
VITDGAEKLVDGLEQLVENDMIERGYDPDMLEDVLMYWDEMLG